MIVHALIIALVIRTFLFQPFNIPSGSMKATLLVGDYLFVSKYSYGYSHYSLPFSPPLFSGRIWASPPDRGDVVVFRLPRDDSTDYIKRVIGLPGDRIQMIDGVLHINGAAGQARAHRGLHRDRGGRRAPRGSSAGARRLPNGVSYTTLDLRRQRLLRQHAGLRRAGRPLLHDGRQPRQLDRQPRARARSAMCRSRISSAAPRSSSSRSSKASAPGWSGAGRGRCAGAGCSRSCDEPQARKQRTERPSAAAASRPVDRRRCRSGKRREELPPSRQRREGRRQSRRSRASDAKERRRRAHRRLRRAHRLSLQGRRRCSSRRSRTSPR